ncbi:tRNA pseudouridine(38-40) synthase TruA [Undibacterium crateris]|uniref:tRNA pseudouridine(38-40) synthase TruA n=1 Tax=Undibacterium crateris TaxID=2528175 RepID=UPI00138A0FE8|nr:tRNA pseudouridine(38-40) synthase TruA [Undibacterium crateris]NDI85138.1 tRNA pseudouridine(38-40) synthase TruA [Undibacterium crateris]
MKRLVLGVQYDGQGWRGWQTQPSGDTVQDALERALLRFTNQEIRTLCAGRTDAGVHGLEQVVHFDTELSRTPYSWVNGVNAFLPPTVAVQWAKELEFDAEDQNQFHARFSARARTYHYVLHNSKIRSPMWIGRAGWVFRPLDLALMQQGAAHLLGEHDFSAFRAAECQAKTPVKHMYEIQIRQHGELFVFTLKASAFLHHMVRNIVGSLIFVGSGKRAPDWMAEVLASRDRSVAAPTFMPDGLYLAKIDYEEKWMLPQPEARLIPGFLSLLS